MADPGPVAVAVASPPALVMVPLSALRPRPHNPKAHDVAGIAASIERHGFVDPVVVDERTGWIAAGHGRAAAVRAVRDAGLPPPARVEVLPDGRWAVPVLRGISFPSDPEFAAYAVADNRLSAAGGWLADVLADVLRRIEAAPAPDGFASPLAGVGFSAAQVDDLAARYPPPGTAPDPALGKEVPDEFPTVDDDLPCDYRCPSCGYEWSGKAE